MAKDLKEQIQIMTHYLNGGEVEFFDGFRWAKKTDSLFSWREFDYRIKEQKKTITIEKWLCEYNGCEELKGSKRFFIIEKAFPFEVAGKKIKRLECYEVEL